MSHEDASRTRAAERYFLNEMPQDERDAFEEHYFGCDICAEDVRVLSSFVENAKVILQDSATLSRPTVVPIRRFGLRTWVPAAIAAALAVTVSVQTYSIQQLRQPQIAAVAVLHGESRGEIPVVTPNQPLSLFINLEQPVAGSPSVVIRNQATGVEQRVEAAFSGEQTRINIYIPRPHLGPGRHAVIIGGTPYPFEVR